MTLHDAGRAADGHDGEPAQPRMTLYELGRIAASHETEIAHATLAAVAVALLDPECEWDTGDWRDA